MKKMNRASEKCSTSLSAPLNENVIGLPEERQQKGEEKICEVIMTENFLKLIKNTNLYIREAQQTISRINTKRPMSRCTVDKCGKPKIKRKILELARDPSE